MKLIRKLLKKKTPSKKIEKAIKKNPDVEHLFIKPIGKAVKEVTNFKLKSPYNTTADFNKILEFKLKKDKSGDIHIHNHIEHLAENMAAIPSPQDLFALGLLSKEYNITSGRIFVTDPKGNIIGQTAYKIGNLDPDFKEELDALIQLTYSSARTNALIAKNKETLKIQKKDTKLFNEIFEIIISTKIIKKIKPLVSKQKESEIKKYLSKNYNKLLLETYKELGLIIHFFPNRKKGYKFDYEKYDFIKNQK